MKVKLLPLKGKYYGTKIELDFEDGGEKEYIKLWDNTGFIPSIREIESHGYTKKQWDNNEIIDDGWGGKINIRSADLVDSTHFESEHTYKRALKLVKLLTEEKK